MRAAGALSRGVTVGHRHFSARVPAPCLILILGATPAFAQLQGRATVGVGVSTIRPSASELTTRVKVRPSLGRVPAHGWGMALALNWFEADVAGDFVNLEGRLGTVTIRPLMIGIGYTWVNGRVAISPSIVAGPALNTLQIEEGLEQRFTVGGGKRKADIGILSAAVRPGVSATYALTRRLGVTAFGGYLFNHPTFTLQTPEGEVQTRWSAGGVALNAGVVVALF